MLRTLLAAIALAVVPSVSVGANTQTFTFGGDQYAAGQQVAIQSPVAHDAFMAGNDVRLNGAVTDNAHLFGMNVTSDADVGGSLYAAAFSVSINGPVGGTVSAAGNSISLRSPATIGGNARLAAANVTLAAPVAGSALVSAQSMTLDSAIGGDFSFYGQNLTFGPGAKVAGSVLIRAPNPIDVPASVAAPGRVTYQELQSPDYASQAANAASGVVGGLWPNVWAGVAWWLLLFVVGAALIASASGFWASLGTTAASRPWRNLGVGILVFAATLGLVPVSVLSIVGLILLPLILLFAVALFGLGYVIGAFHLTLRLVRPFLPVESKGRSIAVLAVGLVAASLLSTIPVLGWLVSLGLTIFGIGTLAVALLNHWGSRNAAKPDGVASPSSI